MTIYLDLYFLINWGMDVSLLACTGLLLRRSLPPKRLFLASLAGAGLACLALAWPPLGSLPGLLLSLLAMVWLGFRPQSPRLLLGPFFFMLLAGFALGGLLQALLQRWPRLLPGLAAAGALLPLALWLGKRLVAVHLARPQDYCQLELGLGQARVTVTLFQDTGNRLQDPLTGQPVAVVAFPALAPLFPLAARQLYLLGRWGPTPELAQALAGHPLATRLRFVPYRTIGQASGLLPVFAPDSAWLRLPDGKPVALDGWLVGVAEQPLSDTYDGLIDPERLKEAIP